MARRSLPLPPRALAVLLLACGVSSLPCGARCSARRPHFAGGDVEEPAVWRALLGWAVEREVVLLTTNERGLTDAVGTLLQLRAHGVQSTLVHATDKEVCDAVYEVVPDGACVWTTWKVSGSPLTDYGARLLFWALHPRPEPILDTTPAR
jgi:hypothetical protein